jgi:pseudaminic acid cytidylyltransferase
MGDGSLIALIPARGGSKRIPNKNIRLFHGKPLLWYAVDAARESELFSRIVVSTDSEAIAGVARGCGAEVMWRPAELATDHATTAAVILHAFEKVTSDLCCIYCNPFVKASTLVSAHELFLATGAHSVVPLVGYSHPVARALRLNADGLVRFWLDTYANARTQDLHSMYHDAGQFYFINRDKFMLDPVLFGATTIPILLKRWEVCDIDDEEDWVFAEKLWQA